MTTDKNLKLAFMPNGNVISLQQDVQLPLQEILSVDFHRHTAISLGMELECEDCCKYVYNGSFAIIYLDFTNQDNSYVNLLAAPGNFLIMEGHKKGQLVKKELLKNIEIPFYRFCSLSVIASRVLQTTYLESSFYKSKNESYEAPKEAKLLDCSVCCTNIASSQHTIPGFLTELKPATDDLLLLRMFSGKRLIKEQYLFKYFIPTNRLCATQEGEYKISPCLPWYRKTSG